MNNNDLPELNIPRFNKEEDKKRKKGLLSWLRGGARAGGGEMATGGAGAGGGALGGGGIFGGGGILSAIAAGKFAGVLAVLALMGVVAGAGWIIHNANSQNAGSKIASAANSTAYVPLSQRDQQNASGLNMLSGKVAGLGDDPANANKKDDKNGADASANGGKDGKDGNADGMPQPDQPQGQGGANGDQMGKLMGANIGALSSQAGNGGGGAGAKLASSNFNAKSGINFGGVMGSFQKPAFNKVASMKGGRNVSASAMKSGRAYATNCSATNSKACAQSNAIHGLLKQGSNLTTADGLKSNADQAWEGQTSGGTATGGAGIGTGDGGGIVTSPSIDNPTSSNSVTENSTTPSTGDSSDATPWAKWAADAEYALVAANIIIAVIAYLSNAGNTPFTAYLKGFAAVMMAVAIALGAFVVGVGIYMMTQGQHTAAYVLTLAGGITTANAILAFTGTVSANMAMILATIAPIVQMLGSLLDKKSS